MKKTIAVIYFMCLMFALQGCTPSNTTDLSDYGKWRSQTEEILRSDFIHSLPSGETVRQYGAAYYYKAPRSVFGDHNFVIRLVLQFPDASKYQEELDKYTEQSDRTAIVGDTYYFLMQYSLDDRLKYTDDEIYDGMFYTFEIISANPEENTICFVSARVWDYHPDQVLIDYLQPISDLESES